MSTPHGWNRIPASLEGASEEELSRCEGALLEALGAQGGRGGNTTLVRVLGWSSEVYWAIRDRLVDQGRLALGKGKGGSVRLLERDGFDATVDPISNGASSTAVVPSSPASMSTPGRMREDELYDPVARVLRESWASDKRYRDLVLEVTARQGKRETGGKWTRPDITLATMTTLLYVPGKVFDVITFEVKPADALDVTAVYGALAHRRAATRSYVWLHVTDEASRASAENLEALIAEAKRHGIGLITGSDPADYETWDEHVEAVRCEPDPQKLNDFISVQFSSGSKDELVKWMR